RAINGGCEFDISDTGCGMENKELAKITEAFYRVDKSRSRAQGGAGLGLTLCKRIVDLHNGNMVFTSKPGSGSRVVVQLFGNMSQEVDYEK
ncbi:ATP-binding protein, partial [Pseudobutyrivibrio sp.]